MINYLDAGFLILAAFFLLYIFVVVGFCLGEYTGLCELA